MTLLFRAGGNYIYAVIHYFIFFANLCYEERNVKPLLRRGDSISQFDVSFCTVTDETFFQYMCATCLTMHLYVLLHRQ